MGWMSATKFRTFLPVRQLLDNPLLLTVLCHKRLADECIPWVFFDFNDFPSCDQLVDRCYHCIFARHSHSGQPEGVKEVPLHEEAQESTAKSQEPTAERASNRENRVSRGPRAERLACKRDSYHNFLEARTVREPTVS